jgi:hypothetical protein
LVCPKLRAGACPLMKFIAIGRDQQGLGGLGPKTKQDQAHKTRTG